MRRPLITGAVGAALVFGSGVAVGWRYLPPSAEQMYRDVECLTNGIPNLEGKWEPAAITEIGAIAKHKWQHEPTLACKAFVRGSVFRFMGKQIWVLR